MRAVQSSKVVFRSSSGLRARNARQSLRLAARSLVLPRAFLSPTSNRMRRDTRVQAEKKDAVDADYEPELDAMDRMEKAVGVCENDLLGIRTGRAQPAMLAKVELEYYGVNTPLQSLASVTTPDAQTLLIKPFDKSTLQSIELAITKTDLNLTPNNDGEFIRISVPTLTEERRKEFVKKASSIGESAKVAVRNVRRDVLKKVGQLEKDKHATEDDVTMYKDEIQKLTDDYVKRVDNMVDKKSKDLMKV